MRKLAVGSSPSELGRNSAMRSVFTLATAFVLGVAHTMAAQEPDRTILPIAPLPFRGTVGTTYKDSIPSAIPPLHAPAGAPNVLLVLLDDEGYGQSGTFGGLIPTPTLDRLATGGLRYTRFHVTALCSPTRAALLTGRNKIMRSA
jgi:hypothetical protein